MVAIAGAVTAALVLRDRDGSGTGTDGSGTETTTEAGDAATGNEVDLDQDDDGRIDRPGPPPGHVEPAAALAPLQVSALVNGNHEGFERVSISFTGDLPPAVELRPDHVSGLVRVWFPETSPSGATDPDAASAAFANSDNGLSAELVIDGTGQAWVDIHSAQPVVAQVFRIVTPAGTPVVAVDLVPADGPWGSGAPPAEP